MRSLIGLGLMLIAQVAMALGLGELRLESHLNQPLRAEIPLHGTEGLEPDQIRARLADVDAYLWLGLGAHERPRGLHFEVVTDGDGLRLRVLGDRPIRQPVMELVIELSWPGGRLQRGYPLLIDPAPQESMPNGGPKSGPKSGSERGPKSAGLLPRQVTVGRGDSLGSIAQGLVEGSDINPTQMMQALFRHNPQAFARGDINAIKLGASLRVPSLAEVSAMDAAEAQRRIYGAYDGEPEPVVESEPTPEPRPEPESEPQTEPELEPEPQPQLEILVLDEEQVMRMQAPELQQRLARVKENNRRAAEVNARLKLRLAELERRLRLVSEQLLAKPVVARVTAPPTVKPAPAVLQPPLPARSEEPGPDSTMLIIIIVVLALMVLGLGGYIWQQRRWNLYREI